MQCKLISLCVCIVLPDKLWTTNWYCYFVEDTIKGVSTTLRLLQPIVHTIKLPKLDQTNIL